MIFSLYKIDNKQNFIVRKSGELFHRGDTNAWIMSSIDSVDCFGGLNGEACDGMGFDG